MTTCQLNEPPFHQCCCVCRNRVVAMPRIGTEGEPGFACALPMRLENDPFKQMVFVNWPEHSAGCECWDDIRVKS